MYRARAVIQGNLIEFHRGFWSEEIVKVNGIVVSTMNSMYGTQHFFTVVEDGHPHQYALTSRNVALQFYIDIFREGKPVALDILVKMENIQINKYKTQGIKLLNQYKLKQALEQLSKAEALDYYDAEIPLYMACIYSLKEDAANGFRSLALAVQKNLPNTNIIYELDNLAFLRIHPSFESFKTSGYKNYYLEEE